MPKYHEYYSIWALKPDYMGPWTLGGMENPMKKVSLTLRQPLHSSEQTNRNQAKRVNLHRPIPKGPGTYNIDTCAPKYLYGNPSGPKYINSYSYLNPKLGKKNNNPKSLKLAPKDLILRPFGLQIVGSFANPKP